MRSYLKILILIVAIYSSFFYKKFKTLKKIKSNKLTGQDRNQLGTEENKYFGFYVLCFNFLNKIDDNYYLEVRKKLYNLLENDPKNKIFLKTNLISEGYEYKSFDDEDSKNYIVNKIVSNKKPSNWGDWGNDDLNLKFFIYENKLLVVCNHAYFDGYDIFVNYLNKFFFDISKKDNLPKIKYVPLFTEYQIIKSFIQISSLSKINLKVHDQISFDYGSKRLNFVVDLDVIKKIKKLNNCSFITASFSFILSKIFYITQKSSLNIGFIGILDNKIFPSFNNMGCINFNIKKELDINKICFQIEKKLKKNKYQMMSTFIGTNIMDMNIKNKTSKIDILYTTYNLSKNKLELDGNPMINSDYLMPFISTPFYCYGSSIGDKVNYFANSNSEDLSLEKLNDSLDDITKKKKIIKGFSFDNQEIWH